MDLMDLVLVDLVVFFAIPTSFQNYPKGYLLRKRVAIICNNNPFTIKTSTEFTVYIAIPHIFHHMYWPHVKNYFQIRFHWFHLHHDFQHIISRSIDHISWRNADFHHDFRSSMMSHDVPVSKALRCFKAVASSCWCGADLCNQGCSSNSLAERRRLGSTFSSRSITSLASWETPSQSSME